MNRAERLLPNGIPRYIRCYDNGGAGGRYNDRTPNKRNEGTIDRYTVVFTGKYRHNTGGVFWHLGMSSNPFHPQGFGQHGESIGQIDRPNYGHLGKKIKFNELPEDCQKLVIQDYNSLWDIN